MRDRKSHLGEGGRLQNGTYGRVPPIGGWRRGAAMEM